MSSFIHNAGKYFFINTLNIVKIKSITPNIL